tara:strand:- start:241 stop:480 length:240 start_codon:yes stop_codon:yes gene_type:complete
MTSPTTQTTQINEAEDSCKPIETHQFCKIVPLRFIGKFIGNFLKEKEVVGIYVSIAFISGIIFILILGLFKKRRSYYDY